jgi:hypothetical protein
MPAGFFHLPDGMGKTFSAMVFFNFNPGRFLYAQIKSGKKYN